MIHHISIGVKEPERVARVLAELWEGYAMPFPVAEGGWIAMTGDANGTEIEVVPMQLDMVPGVGEPDPQVPVGYDLQPWEVHFQPNAPGRQYGSSHVAVSSRLNEQEIYAIARREGWRAVRCDRGPCFPVIEFWLENRFLVEVLTPEMSRKYLDFMKPEGMAALFNIPLPPRAGAR